MFNRSCFNTSKFNSIIAVATVTPIPPPEIKTQRHSRYYKKRFKIVYDIKATKVIEVSWVIYITVIKKIFVEVFKILQINKKCLAKFDYNLISKKRINTFTKFDLNTNKKIIFDLRNNLIAKRKTNFVTFKNVLGKRKTFLTQDYDILASRKTNLKNQHVLNAKKQNNYKDTFEIKAKKDITNILTALDLI